jgi:hypothetical protein
VTTDALHTRAVRRFVLVALVLPVVLVALGVTIQLIAMPHVPANVAVHWNAAGEADRFAPSWTQPVATIAFGLGIPALIALTTLPGMRRGDRGPTYRLLGALAAAMSALLTVALTWSFVAQAGVADASAAPSVWPSLVAALVMAVVVGVAAWWGQPAEAWPDSAAAPASPLDLAAGERAVWLRTVTMTAGAAILILLAVIAVALGAVVAWITGAPAEAAWILTGVAVVLAVFAATTVAFRVRVDQDGLSVDSVAGLPRFRVPLDEVESAARVVVDPMGEFGGWGLRVGAGHRFGVVLRAGEALEVVRRSGRRFVVTVDDAETAASLLQALVDRNATTRP